MKKLPLITLVSFFILIPNINAETDGTYQIIRSNKYHYYFFSEPYDSRNAVNDLKTYGRENYTRFANYREWEIPTSVPIELTSNCNVNGKWDESDCWDLATFYSMWDELENGTIVCKGNTCSRDLKESGIERYYHAHGAYSSNVPAANDWKGTVTGNSDSNTPQSISIDKINKTGKYINLACATINTNNEVTRVNPNGTAISDENYENTYIKIKRTLSQNFDVDRINWANMNPSENSSNCGGIYSYEGKVYSPALYRVKLTTENYACVSNEQSNQESCNDTSTISSTCGKHTIQIGDAKDPNAKVARADIQISQSAHISNILTPNKIYQGGGIKLGFIYYNTVSWSYIDGKIKGDSTLKNGIEAEIKRKLLNENTVANNIAADIKFIDKNKKEYIINKDLMQTQCSRAGEFNEGQIVTTTCTITLPESSIETGTGKVKYSPSIGKGVNNEYYTPMNYTGNFDLKAKLSNLSVLTGLNGWMEDWNITYDGSKDKKCSVNIYDRYYIGDKYKFIYRPINLNNPFPNRNAGVNWFEWYSKESNKQRLESSYERLQYQVQLDNQNVTDIKNYNKNKNKNYLDWSSINKDTEKSEFIDTYNRYFLVRDQEGDNP